MKNILTFQLDKAGFCGVLPKSARSSSQEFPPNLNNCFLSEHSRLPRLCSTPVSLTAFLALESRAQAYLLQMMPAVDALSLAAGLPLHTWIRLAGYLPPMLFKELRRALPVPKRRLLMRILALPKDSAGRLVRDDYVAVNAGTDVSAVRRLLAGVPRQKEVYVIQSDGRYQGTVRVEALAEASPWQQIEQLLRQSLPTVSLHTSQAKAARLLCRGDLSVLPVVDARGRLVGIIQAEDFPSFRPWLGVERLAGRLTRVAATRRAAWISLISVLIGSALLLVAPQAEAVRPFVTDDARIVDVGQIETESWFETVYAGNDFNPAPAFNVMGGTTVNEWLEIIVGSGIGRDAGNRLAIPNPLIQPKILFLRAEKNGRPGFAMGAGTTLDTGRGDLHDPGMSSYLIGMTTWRRLDDWLQIHLNYGPRMDKSRGGSMRIRPYWGLGFDIGVFNKDFRFIIESFAGDPLIFESPKYAGQFGFRWLASDYVNLDLTFGLEPELDEHRRTTGSLETTAQLGIRLLFDAYTPGGRRGDPMGAQGMFPR